jgi:hypothetical protein
MPDINHIYQEVCNRYFPKWRPWELICENPPARLLFHGIRGYCNVTEKKICVFQPLKELFIHEICHAIYGKKHGIQWQRRMRKAIIIAETLEPELAGKLVDDLTTHTTQDDVSNKMREREILDIVKTEAIFYYEHPEALDSLLMNYAIFPAFDDRMYRRIHDKALQTIEHELR